MLLRASFSLPMTVMLLNCVTFVPVAATRFVVLPAAPRLFVCARALLPQDNATMEITAQ
jgi:hypothetical protein